MYEIFNPEGNKTGAVIFVSEIYSINRNIAKETQRLLSFYHTSPTNVVGGHWLLKLLSLVCPSMKNNIDDYITKAYHNSISNTSSIGATSQVSPGIIHDGVFYGKFSKEVIVTKFRFLNSKDLQGNWRDWKPIKVLRHPYTDLYAPMPDGSLDMGQGGYSVIEVDTVLLACQYRMFCLEQMDRIDNGTQEVYRTAQSFLRMYPLANMIPSHIEQAMVNHYIAGVNGYSVPKRVATLYKHPIHWPMDTYQRRFENIVKKQLQLFRDKTMSFNSLLASVQLPFSINWYRFSRVDVKPPSRQVNWAYDIARLSTIDFLIRACPLSLGAINSGILRTLERSLMLVKTSRSISQYTTGILAVYVKDELNTIEARIKDLI